MANKKLVREVAGIIATNDNKDQYGNAKLAEYIIRKIQQSEENLSAKQSAKLAERKQVHEWLNMKGVPSVELGKPICLLRRLSIALEISEPFQGE